MEKETKKEMEERKAEEEAQDRLVQFLMSGTPYDTPETNPEPKPYKTIDESQEIYGGMEITDAKLNKLNPDQLQRYLILNSHLIPQDKVIQDYTVEEWRRAYDYNVTPEVIRNNSKRSARLAQKAEAEKEESSAHTDPKETPKQVSKDTPTKKEE